MDTQPLSPAALVRLTAGMERYHSLSVRPDGTAYRLLRIRVTDAGDLEDAYRRYQTGDALHVERKGEGYWIVTIRRPLTTPGADG